MIRSHSPRSNRDYMLLVLSRRAESQFILFVGLILLALGHVFAGLASEFTPVIRLGTMLFGFTSIFWLFALLGTLAKIKRTALHG